ncbi:MAG TPA: tripartite tricarboxylate transporter substrate binding protein [Ramlibacter sp.]|jgi:tripartite-type tricarboxylate transporter receptor subunit TctC|nr:tripartite tricarboxylate transporter substrate binding protein [Ramlibacter sp.]
MKNQPHGSLSRRNVLALGVGSALAGIGTVAGAQESPDAYPSKPIKFVVPFAAGGGTDILGRQVARAIEPILGKPIIIDNKPGAGGGIGTALVAKADPDGYTMVLGTTATHAMNEFLYGKLPYDPGKDFTPVTLLIKITNVLTVPANSPIKTFSDLLRIAKAQPGKLSYGIVAIGSSSHLASEKLKGDAGINVVGVPYNSQVTGMTDLISGRLDFMFDSIGNSRPHLLAGKLRAIAVTALERSAFLPDVPTIAESGLPGFAAPGWVGLFAPANTHPAIVAKMASAIAESYKSGKNIEDFKAAGFELEAMAPKAYAEFVAAERIKWGKVIREANIKLS